MRTWLASTLFVLYLRLVGFTSRVYSYGEDNLPEKPYIYFFWHKFILFASYTHRGRAVRVLASTSKDGDISARANSSFGHRIIRGTASTSREGAKTLLRIISCLKKNNVVAITPDGPKGPALKAKPGISYISEKIKCPMVPIAWAAEKYIILKSWDKTVVPLPFNRIVVLTGKPIFKTSQQSMEDSTEEIRTTLNTMGVKAEKILKSI